MNQIEGWYLFVDTWNTNSVVFCRVYKRGLRVWCVKSRSVYPVGGAPLSKKSYDVQNDEPIQAFRMLNFKTKK